MAEKQVDLQRVRELRAQAIKYKHQNVPETRLIGQGMEKVLKALGLWELKD